MLNTRVYVDKDGRKKKSKRQNGLRHLRIDSWIFFFYCDCIFVSHQFFLSRCHRWRIIISRTKWMRMMSQKEQPQQCPISFSRSLFLFLLITFENLSSRSITTREDDDDEDDWLCLFSFFFLLFLSLSLSFFFCYACYVSRSRLKQSRIFFSHLANIRERKRRPDVHARSRKWSTIAVGFFSSGLWH